MYYLKNSVDSARETIDLSEGDVLFRLGDPITSIYEIESGQIKFIRFQDDGSEPVIHFIQSGEIVAEASLFSDTYHCHAIANTPTTLRRYKKEDILNKLNSSSEFSIAYIKLLSQQIQRLRMMNEVKSIRSARQRITNYLFLESQDGVFELNTSLKDMANRIGITHETLYRELKSLEQAGMISRTNKIITINKSI